MNAYRISALTALWIAVWPVLGQTNAPPLPPVDVVLARVLEQVQKEDEQERVFKEHYAYERTKVTEYRNSRGTLKKREEDKRSKNPLIVKTAADGSPKKPKTDDEEDVAASGEVTDTNSNVRGKAFEKGDFPLNDELLKRFEFTLVGREMVNGRPALMLDFKPIAGKLPERNLKEKFINKAAGRVWVDEVDYNLPKGRLFLSERVNVVGGLVGAVWKFTYDFDRERTPEGLWYTRKVDWHLEGREVFVRRTVDYHEERTDVKKVK